MGARPWLRLAVLVAALAAGPHARADEAALLKELSDRAPAKFVALRLPMSKPDGTIIALYGSLADAAPGGEPGVGDTVNGFVEKYGSLLGYPAGKVPAPYGRIGLTKSGAGYTLEAAPIHESKAWYSATVAFQLDAAFNLVGATGRYRRMGTVQGGGLDPRAAVELALKAIQEKLPGAQLSSDGSLGERLMGTPDGKVRHIYFLNVVVGAGETARRVMVAADGEVLDDGEGARSFDADGTVFDGYPQQTRTPGAAIPALLDQKRGRHGRLLHGDHFTSHSSAINKACSSRGHFDFPRDFVRRFRDGTRVRLAHPRLMETSVYHHLMRAYGKAKAWGASEVEKVNITYDSWQPPRFDTPMSQDNAYFHDADMTLHFDWYNPGMGFRHPAADQSVIYHEYGHAVQSLLNPASAAVDTVQELGDAGAISEGFGDFFSMQCSEIYTEGELFTPGDIRIPLLALPYCKIMPIYDGAVSKRWRPKGERTEIHEAGQLFSGIAARLSEFDQLDAAAMPNVLRALRSATPTTFRNFGMSLLGVQAIDGDPAKMKLVLKALEESGIFEDCPSEAQ